MKKLYLTLAAVLLATGLSFAQINVGGRAALNFGTVYGDDAKDYPWGVGFAAGVSAKINVNKMFSVVPDIDVNLRRSSDDDASWTVWAVEIPIMARAYATREVFFEAGPMISILLSGKQTYENELDPEINVVSIEYDNHLNPIEFGLSFGLGTAIKPNLDLNFRVNLALTSEIEDIKMIPETIEPELKNLQMQFGATYWFM